MTNVSTAESDAKGVTMKVCSRVAEHVKSENGVKETKLAKPGCFCRELAPLLA